MRHGERATEEVAPQNRKSRLSGMPLPPRRRRVRDPEILAEAGKKTDGRVRTGTHHSRDKKKKKGDVGIAKAEEEEWEIERFSCKVHDFLTDYMNILISLAPAVSSPHVDTNILVYEYFHCCPCESVSSVPASSLSPVPVIPVPASSPVTVPAPVIPAATVYSLLTNYITSSFPKTELEKT